MVFSIVIIRITNIGFKGFKGVCTSKLSEYVNYELYTCWKVSRQSLYFINNSIRIILVFDQEIIK